MPTQELIPPSIEHKDFRHSAVLKSGIVRRKFTADEVKAMCDARGIEFEDGDEKRVIVVEASNERVDRDGDIVSMAGIDMKQFQKNPVILWAHDYRSLPLGVSLKEEITTGDKPTFKSIMLLQDYEGFPVLARVKKGFIKGVSIGFRPKENGLKFPSEVERAALGMGRYGAVITDCELYEISICPVGANQDALVTDVSKALSPKKLVEKEKLSLDRKNLNIFPTRGIEEMEPEELKALMKEVLEGFMPLVLAIKSGEKLDADHVASLVKCEKALGAAHTHIKSIAHDHSDAGGKFTDEHADALKKGIRHTSKALVHMKALAFTHADDESDDDEDDPKAKAAAEIRKQFPAIFDTPIEPSAKALLELQKQFSPTKG